MSNSVWDDESDGISKLLLYFLKWSLILLGFTGVMSLNVVLMLGIVKLLKIGFGW